MKNKIKIAITFAVAIFTVFVVNESVQAANYQNTYITSTVNVRDAKSDRIIDEFYKGQYKSAYIEGNWAYFQHEGRLAKVHKNFVMQANPRVMYVKYPVNVRNSFGSVVGSKYTAQLIQGVKMGNTYRYYENGPKFIHEAYLTSSDITSINGYAYGTTNIRVESNNQIYDKLSIGDYVEGYYLNNYIHYKLNGIPVKVYAPLINTDNPSISYVKYDVNVLNQNLLKVDSLSTGGAINSVNLGDYERYYDNGVKLVRADSLSDKKVFEGQGYATRDINVRNASTNALVDTLDFGSYVEGYVTENYLHYRRNGVEVKVYYPYLKDAGLEKMYVTNPVNVRNLDMSVVSSKSKGDSIYGVRLGDYYRYYDNGAKLIHAAYLSSSYVAPSSPRLYSISEFEWNGVVNWRGYKFTYYSQRVLPGHGLRIPGRHLSNGYVTDGDGYIVLASNYSIPKGTIIETPFGAPGKVYDRCASCSLNWYDVYTR